MCREYGSFIHVDCQFKKVHNAHCFFIYEGDSFETWWIVCIAHMFVILTNNENVFDFIYVLYESLLKTFYKYNFNNDCITK